MFRFRQSVVMNDSDGNFAACEVKRTEMTTRNILLTACVASMFTVALVQRTHATMNPSHMVKITFSQPVGLPGVTLGAGTYIFEVANPMSGADVVRVLSNDRSTSYFQRIAYKVRRPYNLPPTEAISLGEPAMPGSPAPVLAWWHEGSGHELIYSNR